MESTSPRAGSINYAKALSMAASNIPLLSITNDLHLCLVGKKWNIKSFQYFVYIGCIRSSVIINLHVYIIAPL